MSVFLTASGSSDIGILGPILGISAVIALVGFVWYCIANVRGYQKFVRQIDEQRARIDAEIARAREKAGKP